MMLKRTVLMLLFVVMITIVGCLEETRIAIDEDFAQRTGGATAHIVEAEEVLWGNGSYGCPEPGGVYHRATVPGWRVVLSDGSDEYNYHTYMWSDDVEDFLYCENPDPSTWTPQ